MKSLVILSALAVLVVGQGTYNSENDDLDIDALVNSPERLKEWFNCFVDKGPCDKVQTTFKVDLPEAIQLACSKCTEAQKVIMKKFVIALKQKAPADYEVFKKKFDPENKYFDPLEKAIA